MALGVSSRKTLFGVIRAVNSSAATMKRTTCTVSTITPSPPHVTFTRCLERAEAADSEREDALARLRAAAEEAAELKGKANYADSLRVRLSLPHSLFSTILLHAHWLEPFRVRR